MFVFANADNGGKNHVRPKRFHLIHGQLLNRLMRCPDVGGQRHTLRSLSAATGVSKSKLSSMVNGKQMGVDEPEADAIAEAVDIPRGALFTPSVSAFANEDTEPPEEESRC
jgi:hypothetical protein